LIKAVKDGKITAAEKKNLEKLFKTTTPPVRGPEPTPEPGPEPGTQPVDSDGDGIPDDIDEDDDNDGIPDDEEPAHGGPNPTVKGGNKKIPIPKSGFNKANYSIPKNSDERILMPNIDKKIQREIIRLTKRLISSTKEFIEGGINYDGIDFIPDNDILTEDGEEFFEIDDFNSPGTVNSGLANERLNEILEAIQAVLDKGDRTKQNRYNYADYLDLFELRYNNNGDAFYRFSIELVGEDLDYITVTVVEQGQTGVDD